MRMVVVSIYDAGIKAFAPPMYFRHIGEAFRTFTEACRDPQSNLNKFAGDYTMFRLGEWDDGTAVFEPLAAPERALSALEIVQEPPPNRQ